MTAPLETTGSESDGCWEAMVRDLPTELDGQRLLEVRDPSQPRELLGKEEGNFDFVLCRDVLRSTRYPMALLGDLWRLTASGGVLLIESEAVAEPGHSQYTSFVPGANSGSGWVPGRLALRWMVEASGFDVDRWFDEQEAPLATRICLRAIRAERDPASSSP